MLEPLQRDIQWLHALLDEVAPASDCEQAIRHAATELVGDQGGTSESPLCDLSIDQLREALKRLTIRFHLRNKAEQHHIVRVNQQRAREATPESPRKESITAALQSLAQQGVAAGELSETLQAISIQPTLTAHPTEVRRRSVLTKQAEIGDALDAFESCHDIESERRQLERSTRQSLALLMATDEVRAHRLDALDEVRNGLFHVRSTIWHAVPRVSEQLRDAASLYFGTSDVPGDFLSYRSWIGGDRDGNPNVTVDITRRALQMHRDSARQLWKHALEQLLRELSVSSKRVPVLPELLDDIQREETTDPLPEHQTRHHDHEPWRRKVLHMLRRLTSADEGAYAQRQLVADIDLLDRSLRHAGLEEVADAPLLADLRVQAQAFGLHLVSLDVRQHSAKHEAAVAELLRIAGVESDYASLDEERKTELLEQELRSSRPLLPRDTSTTDATQELLDLLALIGDARQRDPDSVGSYIISMTHTLSDLLEVLVLMREAGLYRPSESETASALDVTPLFETVADLAAARPLLKKMFDSPAYKRQLDARGRFQEIMLGYSDSNKDGGYWAANWRLYNAQRDIALACDAAGVRLRFFHGRGGSVARGGGRAQRAILLSPPESDASRIRFTEQGEVISFRYAKTELATRHLEQIVGAVLLSGHAQRLPIADDAEFHQLMEDLSTESMATYRELIDDPETWEWFADRSPVRHIGELPIASRPVSRAGTDLTFDNLRAIPWVFTWTQMRCNIPGWFGLGRALQALVLGNPAREQRCRDEYAKRGFFALLIDNAQQEMARARLPVARAYASRGAPAALAETISREFEATETAILSITGQSALLDNNPVIQASIAQRNPDTDMLNAIQLELLRRYSEDPSRELHDAILLSVNGLAAAMQSTG